MDVEQWSDSCVGVQVLLSALTIVLGILYLDRGGWLTEKLADITYTSDIEFANFCAPNLKVMDRELRFVLSMLTAPRPLVAVHSLSVSASCSLHMQVIKRLALSSSYWWIVII